MEKYLNDLPYSFIGKDIKVLKQLYTESSVASQLDSYIDSNNKFDEGVVVYVFKNYLSDWTLYTSRGNMLKYYDYLFLL